MKTLYIECAMGAAGDMLTAALLELMPDKEAALAKLNAMGIPGVAFEAEPIAKPLPVAAVVLPRESRASVRSRTSSGKPDISAMPPALSATGP